MVSWGLVCFSLTSLVLTSPTRSANISIPSDHQSEGWLYGFILNTSGAETITILKASSHA